MAINKLANTIKVPLKYTQGNFAQRQIKANNLTDTLYKSFENEIKSDYTIFTFSDIFHKIYKIMPDKNLHVVIRTNRSKNYGAYTEYLYDRNKKIIGVGIDLPGIKNSIRTVYIPYLMHEFQHVSDQIFHPKYMARAQSLSCKRLMNNKYERFYDKYYYCIEDCHSEKNKKEILENVKIRTMNFIKKLGIREKLDILQDMRYCLESEIYAYAVEKQTAERLKNKNLSFLKDSLYDMPKHAMFREKIEIVKEIASELIKSERLAHAKRLGMNVEV